MTKQTATSRSAPWCHLKSASESRSDCMRSQNTPRNARPRPDASWASSKGWERVKAHVFLSGQPPETLPGSPTTPDFLHSLKEATSSHKQGLSHNIRNESWREASKDIFQSVRPVGRDDPRRHYWQRNSEKHKGPIRDERSKDLRNRRSAFSRISMAGSPMSYSKTEAHIRDTDRSSELYESRKIKRIKRCETNPQSECELKSQECNLQEDQLSGEQDAHWMDECNDRGKSRLLMNPLSKEGSFEESKPGKVQTSLADLMKQNPFQDRQVLYRQGDQRKKVWEFACALAHEYLHQKYVEEGEQPLHWSDPVVGHHFEMPKPWDDLERHENEQDEPQQLDKTIVSGLHLLLCQPKDLCMDEVVNPTQAAAWFGDQLASGETATLVS